MPDQRWLCGACRLAPLSQPLLWPRLAYRTSGRGHTPSIRVVVAGHQTVAPIDGVVFGAALG